MFGKLTLEAIPYHEPIIMGAVGAMILGGLALFAALTYFGKWKWLWTEWLTSVDHKKIGVMYIIVAMLMLLRGFADAIMMRMHMAAASAGTARCMRNASSSWPAAPVSQSNSSPATTRSSNCWRSSKAMLVMNHVV